MVSMINRSAFILYPKKPFFDWLTMLDPKDAGISEEELASDPTIYLIEDMETDEEYAEILLNNYESMFEFELSAWYTDETLWPEDRTIELFQQWFDVRLHTIILDTVEEPIEKDED